MLGRSWPTLLLTAPILMAQAPSIRWERPVPVPDAETTAALRGGAAISLTLPGEHQIVLAEPVEDWEVGRLPGGTFVVLTGGLNEPLSVHFVDPEGRASQPFRTRAGRRLGGRFAEGLGSWPLVAGPDLWVIAYRESDEIVFKALTTGRGLGPDLRMPLTVTGYDEPRFDPERFELTVRFDGPGAPPDMHFEHPGAPRVALERVPVSTGTADPFAFPELEVARVMPRGQRSYAFEGGILDFGTLAVGEIGEQWLRIRNTGAFPLEGVLEVEPEAVFEATPVLPAVPDARVGVPATSGHRIEVPPGTARAVLVRCQPSAPQEVRGRLMVDSPVRGARAALELRVVAMEPAAVAVTPEDDDEPLFAPLPGDPGAAPAAPESAPRPRLRVAPPTLDSADIRWVAGQVVVRGAIRAPWPGLDLLVRAPRPGVAVLTPVEPDGSFRATLPAAALETLEAAFVGRVSAVSEAVPIGRVPPALLRVEDGIAIEAPPGGLFLVAQVTENDTVLQVWRGRANARGRAIVSEEFFGVPTVPLRLALLVRDPLAENGVVGSPLLTIEPRPGAPR